MANKNIEIEIQVKVEKFKKLAEFLKKKGIFHSKNRQLDEYFTPAHKDFLRARPVKEWLRLRDANGKYSINYKNWHFDKNGKSYYCDEFETKLESIDQTKMIFKALNFQSVVIVDKLREIWTHKDYEIAIDHVKNLGDFIEIEYIGKNEKVDPVRVTEKMVDFLKKIGCGKITRNYVGYPFLILFPEEAEYETE